MDNTKDKNWLDALASKHNSDTNPEEVKSAVVLRQVIQRHNAEVVGNQYDIDSELKRLNQTLSREGLLEEKRSTLSLSKRWSAFLASMLSAFALGAIVMRFAMMPGIEGVKSEGKFSETDSYKRFVQTVPVKVGDPNDTMKLVTSEAARLGLDFSVIKTANGYKVGIKGLVPNSYDQGILKVNHLGISNSVGGDLDFEIQHKSGN